MSIVKNKEDWLVLENEDGSGQLISSQKLKMILDVCNSKLEVVFLSSCYSESEAEVLLNAGAKHVVCIQKTKKVMDEACIKFSRSFYQALFSECRTPCESFNIAQQTLSISQGLEGQSALFIMKTRNSIKEEHKCGNFTLFRGKSCRVDKYTKGIRLINNLPTRPEPFIGRNNDVRQVLQHLKKGNRLVTITGEPGIGKTAVSKAVVHYLKERDDELVKNGIVFLNVVSCASLPQLIHTFNSAVEEGDLQQLIMKVEKKDTMQVFKEVLKFIKSLDMLLVIDNAEDLMYIDRNILKEFLEIFMHEWISAKVLLTSKIEPVAFLGGISGIKDSVIKLKPLTTQFSEKLLCEKAGKVIPKDERLALQKRDPEKVHGGFKSGYHHLFESLLGGHPIAISLAGSLYSKKSLNELYDILVSTTLLNSLTQGTAARSLVSDNLTLSLNLTLKLFNDKNIFKFFMMMGYFPGGARDEDIDHLWKSMNKGKLSEWKIYCTYLENASIVIKKKVKFNKESIEVYQLVPMLKNIAEEIGVKHERQNLHKLVTKYYSEILEQILRENSVSDNSKDNEVLMNNLWFFETNVWDWVYRALEIKKNLSISRIDTSITEESKSRVVSSEKKQSRFKNQTKNLNNSDSFDEMNHMDTNALFEAERWENVDLQSRVQKFSTRKLTETNLLNLININRENQKKEQEEEDAFEDVLNKLKGQIMPRTTSGDIEDSNVLSFIQKSVLPDKNETKLIKPKPKVTKKKKVESGIGDNTSFLIREMDKRLKKTINKKVGELIKNDKKLSNLTWSKSEVYSKLAHRLTELQDNHKHYKGECTNEVFTKGRTLKEINDDGKILILYLSNLILFSKKSEAVKTIDEYGKYFYDRNLWEANIRKLRGIALIRNKKDKNFEDASEAVKEFLHAKVIFKKHEWYQGVGICCAAIGFILYEIFIHFVKNRVSLLKYAKKTFVESLLSFEIINHKYGMSFCYDMLQDIKRNIGENFSVEYRNYILLQSKIKEDIEHDRFHFIERSQGAEMSIFIENVMTVASSSIISKHDDSNLDDLVSHILDRKKFVEALDQENEKESKNFMNTFMAMITEPNHSSSKFRVNCILVHQNIRQSSNGQPGISKISIGQQNILQPNASHHSIVPSNLNPQTSTNGSNKFRSSVEVHDHESLQSVFRKAQKGINCRDNLRKKAMVSESIELPSNNEDPNYLRSITSKFKSSKYKKNISLQRFITSRTRIINSEDESVESSDNEFSKKSRHYNNPMRVSCTLS